MCSGSEAGSYLRLIDSCITQLKAQGPSRTCRGASLLPTGDAVGQWFRGGLVFKAHRLLHPSTLGSKVIKKKKMRLASPIEIIGQGDDCAMPAGVR